ncbi:hypothetical protein M3Y97_01116500 [Aphelenchoides bicaudatus]|nr:hypothetical protein M3Y97_01116500 [Aphelenchoides bicaudatus]
MAPLNKRIKMNYGTVYYNRLHTFNNFCVCLTESIIYGTLIVLYLRATRSSSSRLNFNCKTCFSERKEGKLKSEPTNLTFPIPDLHSSHPRRRHSFHSQCFLHHCPAHASQFLHYFNGINVLSSFTGISSVYLLVREQNVTECNSTKNGTSKTQFHHSNFVHRPDSHKHASAKSNLMRINDIKNIQTQAKCSNNQANL